MNAFVLLIPFLLIRFTLLYNLDKEAIGRAAYFPPMKGMEILVYWVYQISNVSIIVYLYFLSIKIEATWICYIGLLVYILGLIFCTISIINFAKPSKSGFNGNGIYHFSRNPIYVSYFVFFIGCFLLTQSLVLLGIIIVFQASTQGIILYEERWCINKFKEEYQQYMNEVRRYI